MNLPSGSSSHHLDLGQLVKVEDIKVEDCVISCQDEEEKAFAEFQCKTERDDTESPCNDETLQTTVMFVIKKGEDEEEHGYQRDRSSYR